MARYLKGPHNRANPTAPCGAKPVIDPMAGMRHNTTFAAVENWTLDRYPL